MTPLFSQTIDHPRSLKILTIGDSNGAAPDGWVTQKKDAVE